jgi:hypothetical protein
VSLPDRAKCLSALARRLFHREATAGFRLKRRTSTASITG